MIFTLTLWAITVFLFVSDFNNKTNRWIGYCCLVTSIGTFKEFFIDNVIPFINSESLIIGLDDYLKIDGCLTAILYLVTPFCFITLAFYFSNIDQSKKELLKYVQILTIIIIAVCLIIYSPLKFKYFQENSTDFWYTMSSINIGYAVAGSLIVFRNIKKETVYEIKRRKRTTLFVFLLPYYYWLFSIFIIHTFNFEGLKKVWKYNVYIMAAVILVYAYLAYKEGFMGLKLSITKYDWNSQSQLICSSTQYINHMLKNQATKINWSVDNLRKKLNNEQIEELDIIERATNQLINFTQKTNKYLSPKIAGEDICCASNLIFEAVESLKPSVDTNTKISVACKDDVLIICDAQSIVEVIYNILKNAMEAIYENGIININTNSTKNGYCIEITDNGIGITKEQLSQLFLPFYTTKKNNINFGMGLPYCKNVMQAHDGLIQVFSNKGSGTKFILHFPLKRIKRKEVLVNEKQNQNINC